MYFTSFYVIQKTRLSKWHANHLEIDLSAYLEQDDACLAVDHSGNTREYSASDITPQRAKELAAFVDGWLYGKKL